MSDLTHLYCCLERNEPYPHLFECLDRENPMLAIRAYGGCVNSAIKLHKSINPGVVFQLQQMGQPSARIDPRGDWTYAENLGLALLIAALKYKDSKDDQHNPIP